MKTLLPKTLIEIAQVIGEAKATKLVESYAGHRIYIPLQITLDWGLLSLLGYEAAYALSARFGGEQIEIPTCYLMKMRDRNALIVEDRRHLSVSQLAHKYQLSRSSIQKIVNR